MSNLQPSQIKEIERLWKDPDSGASLLVDPPLLADIGRRFPPSLPKKGRGPEHEPGMREAIETAAKAKIAGIRTVVEDALCKNWNYCAKRKQLGSEGFQLALAVADGLLGVVTKIPVPITALSVYLVKRKLLDNLCHCDQEI